MQIWQDKTHDPDMDTEVAGPMQKAPTNPVAATRIPAWVNASGEHVPAGLQAKLTINQPGDVYEQEADRVAEQVMRMPAEGTPGTHEDVSLMRKESSGGQASHDAPPVVQQALSSGGQPLDAGMQETMGARFGQDFTHVRVHTDGQAAESAQAIHARAYTVGSDVVFGEGQYTPGTSEGQRLLAHELTHVVQQHTTESDTNTFQTNLMVSEPNNASRQEANRIVQRIGSNQHFSVLANGSGLQLQRQPITVSAPPVADVLPPWSKVQLGAIQRQLAHLGLYRLKIDQKFGPGTETGLIEAFGGDEWRTLAPNEIIARLSTAVRPAGKRGEHNLRYGTMFKDGVLDITLGIGFDEGGAHLETVENFKKVLTDRIFKEDSADAKKIYQQAGRVLGPSAFGTFFVKRNALVYKPPAGAERPVHAVVRLLFNSDGNQGAQASAGFREGMAQSDIAYYSGHGRYGSGPDFDRNMSFELLDKNGTVVQRIEDYEVLEKILREEGSRATPRRGAWDQFIWRVHHHRINVIGYNLGNVYLNPTDMHSGEFGAKLIYWNLKRKSGQGATPITGPTGEMATPNPERKYQLWVFDGCRTKDYVRSIRTTPGHDPRSTDILATKRTLMWGDETATLAAFLDGVLGQQSAEEIITGMDALQSPEHKGGSAGGAYEGYGIQDNPIIR